MGRLLKIAAKKHDLSAIRITDRHEQSLPDIGLVKMHDNETGLDQWIDTSSASIREQFARQQALRNAKTEALLKKYGIDRVDIQTGDDFAKPLIKLFKMRQ